MLRWPWRVLAASALRSAAIALMPERLRAWDQNAIERIALAVVTIEIDQTRAFDTEWNQSSQATGFVVDAERGLILTNRHVVTPGPVRARRRYSRIARKSSCYAVYRDPVHDFGFYRYDPAKLRFIKPPRLPLYPEGARIGTRDPRRRQRRGRAALDPRGHARAARP